MRKKFKDNKKEKTAETSGRKNTLKLSKAWEEQYIARAERREKELFGGKQPQEREVSDDEIEESYQKLMNSLREKKKVEKFFQGRYRRSVHLGKIAGIALVCCACIFAASMTSEANRAYFVKNVRYLMGDDTRIILDNDDTNESADLEEYQVVQDIEEKLEIDMPEFYYRPQGLEFRGYEVNTSADNARMEYTYKDIILSFYINKEDENTASNINSAHGEKKETVITVSDGIEVSIEKIQDIQDKVPSYSAQWEMGDTFYYLSGKIEFGELKKMIEQMKF